MQPDPFILTFFGITGDLSQHKLIPALYDIFCRGDLPADFTLIGYGRRDFTEDAFRDFITQTLPNSKRAADFCAHWHYVQGEFDSEANFRILTNHIEKADPTNSQRHLFYLAVAPEFYIPLTTMLHEVDALSANKPHSAVLIEKPYGTNEASAVALTDHLHTIVDEAQIFRVDHFMGKQSVRDLPALPPADQMHAIHILAAEDMGIGNRGAYYDGTGVIRDMIQNHCLMVLAHLLMQENRAGALASLSIPEIVTGQYTGYVDESHVAPNSTTETFAACKVATSLADWQHITMTIRTGKHLPKKTTKIIIETRNSQIIHSIQPTDLPNPRPDYGNVLLDALSNQHTYFISDEEVQAAWRVIDPVITSLKNQPPLPYAIGSWGPSEAESIAPLSQ